MDALSIFFGVVGTIVVERVYNLSSKMCRKLRKRVKKHTDDVNFCKTQLEDLNRMVIELRQEKEEKQKVLENSLNTNEEKNRKLREECDNLQKSLKETKTELETARRILNDSEGKEAYKTFTAAYVVPDDRRKQFEEEEKKETHEFKKYFCNPVCERLAKPMERFISNPSSQTKNESNIDNENNKTFEPNTDFSVKTKSSRNLLRTAVTLEDEREIDLGMTPEVTQPVTRKRSESESSDQFVNLSPILDSR